jgi:hypothetical protein
MKPRCAQAPVANSSAMPGRSRRPSCPFGPPYKRPHHTPKPEAQSRGVKAEGAAAGKGTAGVRAVEPGAARETRGARRAAGDPGCAGQGLSAGGGAALLEPPHQERNRPAAEKAVCRGVDPEDLDGRGEEVPATRCGLQLRKGSAAALLSSTLAGCVVANEVWSRDDRSCSALLRACRRGRGAPDDCKRLLGRPASATAGIA